jgi:hypothetical protein
MRFAAPPRVVNRIAAVICSKGVDRGHGRTGAVGNRAVQVKKGDRIA